MDEARCQVSNQKGEKMENSIETLKEAMKRCDELYGKSVGDNLKKGINWAAHINGWTAENAYDKYVEFCLKGAEEYKANHAYSLEKADDAGNIALYANYQLGNDISDMIEQSKK